MGLFRRKTVTEQDHASDGPEERAEEGARPLHPAAVHAGVPGRCPVCDGFGYIDHIDLRNRVQIQHCRACRHVWEFSFDAEGVVIDLRDPTRTDSSSR
jgi:hypothetical protein